MTEAKTPNLEYPPEVFSVLEAVTIATKLRHNEDRSMWAHGWLYVQAREKFGREINELEWQRHVGVTQAQLHKMHLTCRAFRPEDANQFPGLPFNFFYLVANMALESPEGFEMAMALLESAYDTPGLTLKEFRELITEEEPAEKKVTLQIEGNLHEAVMRDGKLYVTIMIEREPGPWQNIIMNNPLYGNSITAKLSSIRVPQGSVK
jgi:hypothetical protein